jgi:hypothetical protein
MTRRTAVTVAISCIALSTGQPASAQDGEARDEIEGVLADFVRGWREGDAETLERVLALDAGYVQWVSGEGEDERASAMTFRDIVARNRDHPDYGLTGWEIVSFDVVEDELAVAKLVIHEGDVLNVDYMVLYRIAGDWKIVSNTFVIVPK